MWISDIYWYIIIRCSDNTDLMEVPGTKTTGLPEIKATGFEPPQCCSTSLLHFLALAPASPCRQRGFDSFLMFCGWWHLLLHVMCSLNSQQGLKSGPHYGRAGSWSPWCLSELQAIVWDEKEPCVVCFKLYCPPTPTPGCWHPPTEWSGEFSLFGS